jgi:uncharacterized surface anchored protein
LPNAILETDDRGVYRVFGLPPGRYLVSAGTGGESAAADFYNRRFSYPRTFYPNVIEEAKATVIEVAAGGEIANVDITLSRRAESYSASGHIVDARTSQPLAGLSFGYAATRDGRMSGAPVRDLQSDAEGKFVIPKLTPGRYVVFVSANTDTNVYSEMLPFEVTKGDVTDLELRAEQGASVSGTVVVEGAPDASLLGKLAGVSVANILYQPEMTWTTQSPPVINPDGSFRFNGLRPGKLKLVNNAQQLPRGFSVLRVERDGIAQRDGIEVPDGGGSITGVRIVMAYGNGIVRGQVALKSSELPAGTPLFVFARRADSPSITASTQTDARGSFILEWLAPGEYELTVGVRGQGGMRLSAARQTVRVTNNATAEASLIFETAER